MRNAARWLGAGIIFGTLALAMTASATGAKKLPEYDLTTDKGLKKAAALFHYTSEGKIKTFPKKVAIPYFQIRYRFEAPAEIKSNSSGWSRVDYTLQLTDDDYTTMTDMLYEQAVAELTAEGFDVVPREAVIASSAYQALEGEIEEKVSGKRARYAPTGMKNLKTRNGQAVDAPDFAAISQQVGADASVAIFANIGICSVEQTNKHIGGILPCLYGALLQYPGLSVELVGGAEQKGDKVKPEWDFRVYKDIYMYKYGGDVGFDAAFFGLNPAMTPGRKHFWTGREWDAQSAGFIEGGGSVFDDAMTVAMYVMDTKSAKQRAAAGVQKRDRPELAPMPVAAPPPVPEGALTRPDDPPPAPPDEGLTRPEGTPE